MDEVTESLKQNQHDFIKKIFLNHTNIGARLVCYCGKKMEINESKISLEIEEYNINIPSNCKYAKNDKLYIPLFTKNDNIIEKDFETFFKPFPVISNQETIEELHFNNKELLFNTIQTLNYNKNDSKLNTLCKAIFKK